MTRQIIFALVAFAFCVPCFAEELPGTVFAGHHQPLSVWMLCLYFMGLNLSNRQIAAELELNEDSIQEMTSILRHGIVAQEPTISLERENSLLRALVETLVCTNQERR